MRTGGTLALAFALALALACVQGEESAVRSHAHHRHGHGHHRHHHAVVGVAKSADANVVSHATSQASHVVAGSHVSKQARKAKQTPATPAAPAKPVAPSAPMSPAMMAVVNMTVQFFVVYLLLQVVQARDQLTKAGSQSNAQEVLLRCAGTCKFAPMLCILFLACRMRATSLGTVPPVWGQSWMVICAFCLLTSTILVFLQPMIAVWFGSDTVSDSTTVPLSGFALAVRLVFKGAETIAKLGVYVGFTVVIFALLSIKASTGNANCPDCGWQYTPQVAPALGCTIALTVLYFSVYLLLEAIKVRDDFLRGQHRSVAQELMERVTKTTFFCPMLAILFIGVRMRALQLDPNGSPQVWAQVLFFCATASIFVATTVELLLPIVTGAAFAERNERGEVEQVQGSSRLVTRSVMFIKYLGTFVMYAATVGILISVPLHTATTGATPPVSPAMLCVMILTVHFFIVKLLIDSCLTYRDLYCPGQDVNVVRIMGAAEPTVEMVPMLCVLFIGVRMRALEIGQPGPQHWAQQAMFVATVAVMCMGLIASISKTFEVGEVYETLLGEDDAHEGKHGVLNGLNLCKALFLLMICAAVGTIITSTFIITAASATTATAALVVAQGSVKGVQAAKVTAKVAKTTTAVAAGKHVMKA